MIISKQKPVIEGIIKRNIVRHDFLLTNFYSTREMGHSDAENEQLGRKLGFDLGMSC